MQPQSQPQGAAQPVKQELQVPQLQELHLLHELHVQGECPQVGHNVTTGHGVATEQGQGAATGQGQGLIACLQGQAANEDWAPNAIVIKRPKAINIFFMIKFSFLSFSYRTKI